MTHNTGYSESYARASRIIYKIMSIVGWLFIAAFVLFVILKQFFVKILSFLFDGDHVHTVLKTIVDIIGTIVSTITGKASFSTEWVPHTNHWSASFEHATTHSGATLMMWLGISFVVLLLAYIFTIVMRHHNGEMAPLLNDSESRKVRRKIIRKIDAGYIDRSERKGKEKHRKPSKFELKVKRHIRRRLKVRIHTFIPENTPVPIKHYHIRLLAGKTDPINEKIKRRIKDLEITLTQITNGISFDQQKTSKDHRYYIFEGRQQKELKEAKSVVERRKEKYNQAEYSNGEEQSDDYNFPLDILSEDPQKIEQKTRKAEKFAERNQGKVDILLASMNMQVEAKPPHIFNSAIEYVYGTRFSKTTKSLDEIAKAVEQELSIPDITVDKRADNMIINIPLPEDDRIPVDGGILIKEAFSSVIENPTQGVLGRGIKNQPVDFLFSKGPHTLLAGTTGSGKTVASKFTLISMMAKTTPDELKMQIIDPKQADFVPFNKSPYNLTDVITDVRNDAAPFLKYIVYVMEERYTMFKNAGGTENIEEYNEWAEEHNKEKLPYILVFIDEVADLMIQIQDEIEAPIQRLGQMGRASGVHLIMSTQRPSREVITGLIKTNLPTRWAMRVANDVDSRIILDESGAEKLTGVGDMLFAPQGNRPIRVKNPNITRKQIDKIFSHLNEKFEKSPSPDYHAIVARREAEENGEDEEANDTFEALSGLQQTRLDSAKTTAKTTSSKENKSTPSESKDESQKSNVVTLQSHDNSSEPAVEKQSESNTEENDALAQAIANREKRKKARKRKDENLEEQEEEQPTFELDTSNLIRDKDKE